MKISPKAYMDLTFLTEKQKPVVPHFLQKCDGYDPTFVDRNLNISIQMTISILNDHARTYQNQNLQESISFCIFFNIMKEKSVIALQFWNKRVYTTYLFKIEICCFVFFFSVPCRIRMKTLQRKIHNIMQMLNLIALLFE